jgi:hypothetical protein
MNGEQFEAWRTSSTENFAQLSDVVVNGDELSFLLPADSVESLLSVPEPDTIVVLASASVLLLRRPRTQL